MKLPVPDEVNSTVKVLSDFCNQTTIEGGGCENCPLGAENTDTGCLLSENLPFEYAELVPPTRWTEADVSIAAGLKMMGYTHITKRGEKPLAMIEMPQGEPIVHAMNLPAFLCLGKGEVVPIADILEEGAG